MATFGKKSPFGQFRHWVAHSDLCWQVGFFVVCMASLWLHVFELFFLTLFMWFVYREKVR